MSIDIAAYYEWCDRNGVVLDDGDGNGTEESKKNAQFVADYFTNTWKQPLNAENLEKAKDVLLPHLTRYASPADAEYAKLNWADRQAFAAWRTTAGLTGAPQNANAMLGWLKAHSLPATNDNFILASGQQRVQHFLAWEYKSTFKPSAHSETDNGQSFLGIEDMVKILDAKGNVIGLRSKNHADYEKERREREAASQPQPELSSEEQRWRQLANSQLSYGTHGQQKQIKDVFDECRTKNCSWRQTYDACVKLVQQLKRRTEGAVLVR